MACVIAAPCIDQRGRSGMQVRPADRIRCDPVIGRQRCVECGRCQRACPNDAIFREDGRPAPWQRFAGIAAAWCADPDAARAGISRSIEA